MAASNGNHAENDEATKPGPANPQDTDLDAPTPPGGPLRSDSPSGPTAPGGPGAPAQPGRPEEESGSMRPIDEPVGPPAEEATVPDDREELSENQPSDDSGEH